MAWPPENGHIQVFDERSIKKNVIDFLRLHQGEALVWANNGEGLDEIKKFHKSARLVSVFPALTCLQTEHSIAYSNSDIGVIVFSMVWELAIVHGNQDVLADLAPVYVMALESMLANIPETTLNESSIIPITSTLTGIQTTFDVQGKIKNRFIQVSQTRISWAIDAATESE